MPGTKNWAAVVAHDLSELTGSLTRLSSEGWEIFTIIGGPTAFIIVAWYVPA